MHVLNIHSRTYNLSQEQIYALIQTLASPEDQIWPSEKWPKMKLDNGFTVGSKGGHGPIRYYIESITPGKGIVFRLTQPLGFNGVHKFDINAIQEKTTELVHTIDMDVSGMAYLKWILGIKWLHNALIEDGLDKIHNKITGDEKVTKWNLWVKFLRLLLK